jgi:hypothetical protein
MSYVLFIACFDFFLRWFGDGDSFLDGNICSDNLQEPNYLITFFD